MNWNLYSPDEEDSVYISRPWTSLNAATNRKKKIFPAGDRSPVFWSVYEFGSVPGPLLQTRSGVWTDRSGLLMVRPVTGSCRPASRPALSVLSLMETLQLRWQTTGMPWGFSSLQLCVETPLTAWPGTWETSPSLPITNTDYYIPQAQHKPTVSETIAVLLQAYQIWTRITFHWGLKKFKGH